MKVKIHRGSKEIGGSCIEVEAAGSRILLDLGLPLDGNPDDVSIHPNIPGLDGKGNLAGLFLSHGHLDHWGLAHLAGKDLPIASGAATNRILRAASPFVPHSFVPHATLELRDRCPLTVGPFKITPYLVDHSAYDAYALEVEAGGRKLFYSGDLRAHGREAALFERLISNPPPDVDVLLMEGSTLGRLDAGLEFPTESEIEDLFVRIFNRTPGMALVSASAQNIDRIVSLHRACKRADRTLVIDLYAAEILRATGNSSIPQSDWPNVAVFLPHYQRVRIKQTGRFNVLDPHKTNRVYAEDLSALAPRAAFLFRSAMLADLDRAGCLNQTVAVWSQWAGYLREDRGGQLVDMLKRMGIGIEHAHTSGHASLGDLKRFAKAIAPRKLVPIHTFEPLQFQDYFGSMVHQLDDGEWLEISE